MVQSRQPEGAPNSTGGQFGGAEAKPDGVVAELARPNVLAEAPEWANGGQQHGVTVVESPVSDRDHNYWLNFTHQGAWISVNPHAFGIQHPDEEQDWEEQARLYIGADTDDQGQLTVQYVDSEYMDYSEELDAANLTAEQRDQVEANVRAAVLAAYGPSVAVQFDERGPNPSWGDLWNDIRGVVNTHAHAETNSDGARDAYTSNIMFELEENPAYRAVRDGSVEQLIQDSIANSLGIE